MGAEFVIGWTLAIGFLCIMVIGVSFLVIELWKHARKTFGW